MLGHKFFEGLDIDKLMQKQLQPLYMPEIKDCEFFDQKLVQMDPEQIGLSVVPMEMQKMIVKKQKEFDDFSSKK